jgi:opacity protein-like surface antigen
MRRPLIALAVLLLSLFAADAARADDAVAGRCEARVIEQPFTAWDDSADYFLAPDGDFSSGAAGWDLAGAELVAENEPWYVHGVDTDAAVSLESGASATSPTICVAQDDPTMRFFARNNGGGSGALQVDVLYTDELGEPQSLTIGTIFADGVGEWTPAEALPITANTYEMTVAFRFTAVGPGSSWLIDDVFVDPYRKGRADQ